MTGPISSLPDSNARLQNQQNMYSNSIRSSSQLNELIQQLPRGIPEAAYHIKSCCKVTRVVAKSHYPGARVILVYLLKPIDPWPTICFLCRPYTLTVAVGTMNSYYTVQSLMISSETQHETNCLEGRDLTRKVLTHMIVEACL